MADVDEDRTKKDFLGRGWAFPVARDPRTGLVSIAAFEDDVRQSILIILKTRPGERLMRPEFGCGINDVVFDAIDARTLSRIEQEVRASLIRFEARIELIAVDVDPARAADGILTVSIDYRVRRTNQTGNIVYPFYFREGSAA